MQTRSYALHIASLASFWGLAVLQFFFLESQFSKVLGPSWAPIFFLESQFSKFLGFCCAPIFFWSRSLASFWGLPVLQFFSGVAV